MMAPEAGACPCPNNVLHDQVRIGRKGDLHSFRAEVSSMPSVEWEQGRLRAILRPCATWGKSLSLFSNERRPLQAKGVPLLRAPLCGA